MDQILPLLVIIGISLLVFILIREIIMWYYKINQRIELMKETNKLPKQIYMKLPDEPLKSEEAPVK